MKNHYALIRVTNGHANVLRTFPFDSWAMAARWLHRQLTRETLDVAEVPRQAQQFINVCEQRDAAIKDYNDKVEKLAELEARYGEAHPALVILWKLVAKDDEGVWETVFDAGTKLDPDDAKLLERLLGFGA